MTQVTCDLMWVYHLLREIGVTSSCPMQLWCDNPATIRIDDNPIFHERTKHIEVDCYSVWEKLQ